MTTDPSSDVLERVATAIRAKHRELYGLAPLPDCDALARAAIAAMPTIERLSAERMQLREALELFTGQAVFDPHTHRASVDEFVVSKARAALSNTAENG